MDNGGLEASRVELRETKGNVDRKNETLEKIQTGSGAV